MDWSLVAYGLGYGVTAVVMTRWYVAKLNEDGEPSTFWLAVAGFFGLFTAILWPLVLLSVLLGLAVRQVTR